VSPTSNPTAIKITHHLIFGKELVKVLVKITTMNRLYIKTLVPLLILMGLVALFANKGLYSVAQASPSSSQAIQWVSLEEAFVLSEKNNKPIFINIYKEGSNGCKKMEVETFSKPSIIAYINKHYYAVRIDASSQQRVKFKDSEIGLQQLTQHIFGVNSYPSMVYINRDKVMTTVPGYQDPHDFEMYLRYFGKTDNDNK
jgi:thioredoxin-related protein